MRSCPPVEQLRRLLEEEPSSAAASRLHAHVQDCPDCHRSLDELTADPRFANVTLIDSPRRAALLHARAGGDIRVPGAAPSRGGDRPDARWRGRHRRWRFVRADGRIRNDLVGPNRGLRVAGNPGPGGGRGWSTGRTGGTPMASSP